MELVSLHLGFAAAPGFAHNWVTRLQQGRCGALLVLLPYLASKIAHRRSQGRVWFSLQNKLTPPPLGGRARYRLFGSLGFSRREARCFSAGKDGYFLSEGFSRQLPLATAAHNWGTLAQQGRSGGFGGVAPLLGPQNRTQGHTGASLVLACWLAILRKIAFRNPV